MGNYQVGLGFFPYLQTVRLLFFLSFKKKSKEHKTVIKNQMAAKVSHSCYVSAQTTGASAGSWVEHVTLDHSAVSLSLTLCAEIT